MKSGTLKGVAIAGALRTFMAPAVGLRRQEGGEGGPLEGANDCKGKGACKSASHDCKGKKRLQGPGLHHGQEYEGLREKGRPRGVEENVREASGRRPCFRSEFRMSIPRPRFWDMASGLRPKHFGRLAPPGGSGRLDGSGERELPRSRPARPLLELHVKGLVV